MSLVAVIGTRLDVYSLFYAAWLCYFYNRERRGIARVWRGFVIFITILIPLQYLMCVGIPPGICTGEEIYSYFVVRESVLYKRGIGVQRMLSNLAFILILFPSLSLIFFALPFLPLHILSFFNSFLLSSLLPSYLRSFSSLPSPFSSSISFPFLFFLPFYFLLLWFLLYSLPHHCLNFSIPLAFFLNDYTL